MEWTSGETAQASLTGKHFQKKNKLILQTLQKNRNIFKKTEEQKHMEIIIKTNSWMVDDSTNVRNKN